jgi:choline dehydrogenase
MPGALKGRELEDFIRDAAETYHHQTCTAKMGLDSMSVVDAKLKVHGIESLRIADGSIMPRVATGNTMAPCVVIGERAAEMLQSDHRLEASSVSRSSRISANPVPIIRQLAEILDNYRDSIGNPATGIMFHTGRG